MAYELMTYYESQGKDGYDLCLPWGNMVPAFEWCSTMFDLHFHCISDDLHHVEWTRAWQPIYFLSLHGWPTGFVFSKNLSTGS